MCCSPGTYALMAVGYQCPIRGRNKNETQLQRGVGRLHLTHGRPVFTVKRFETTGSRFPPARLLLPGTKRSRDAPNAAGARYFRSPQLGVFRLGLLENRNVGVGVLPEREETFIRTLR